MKKFINSFKLIIFIVFLFIGIVSVFANNPGSSSEGLGEHNIGKSCDGSFCYTSYDPYRVGVRFSLYYYTGGGKANLRKVGKSRDLVNMPNINRDNIYVTEGKGRLDYTQIENSQPVFVKKNNVHFPTFSTEPGIFNLYGGRPDLSHISEPKFRASIWRYFMLEEGTEAQIAERLNTFFRLQGADRITNQSDVWPHYIIAEPTVRHSVTAYKGAATNHYYGTIYEVIREVIPKMPHGLDRFGSILYSSLNQADNDIHNLVAPNASLAAKEATGYFIDSVTSVPPVAPIWVPNYYPFDELKLDKLPFITRSIYENPRSPYGISIYWISAFQQTCQSVCGNLGGSRKLACAEKFCNKESSSGDKKYCMEECGVTPQVYHTPCPDIGPSKTPDQTVCESNYSSDINTCKRIPVTTKDGFEYFYLEKCITKTDIAFPNIPGIVKPGEGFEYPTLVSGSKNCTLEFDDEHWAYAFAATLPGSREETMAKAALKDFRDRQLNSYTYDSRDLDIVLKVKYEADKKERNVDTRLVPDNAYAFGDKTIQGSSINERTLSSYRDEKVHSSNEFVVSDFKTLSTNGTMYRLPAVCINTSTNTVSNVCSDGKTAKQFYLGPYNKFYTDLKATINGDISTSTIVTDNNLSTKGIASNICTPPGPKALTCRYSVTKIEQSIKRPKEDKNFYNGDKITFALGIEGDRSLFKEAGMKIGSEEKTLKDLPINMELTLNFDENSIKETGYGSYYVDAWIKRTDDEKINCPLFLPIKARNTCPDYACVCLLTTERRTDAEGNKTITYKFTNINPETKYYINVGGPFNVNNPLSEAFRRTEITIKEGPIMPPVYATTVYKGVIQTSENCEYIQKPATCEEAITTCAQGNKASLMHCVVAFCDDEKNRTTPRGVQSKDECITSCTAKKMTCKQRFLPNEIEKIKTYCTSDIEGMPGWKRDGYTTPEICISDCSSYGSRAIYRPVNIDTPFPDRAPIGNWNGLEALFEKESIQNQDLEAARESAAYVVTLDGSSIKKIRNSNNELNKSKQNAYTSLLQSQSATNQIFYKSKFIYDDDITNHGFYDIFSKRPETK